MRLSSQSRFNLFIFIVFGLLMTYAGCGGRDLMGDTKTFFERLFGPKTPRTAYRKTMLKEGWATDLEVEVWDAAYEVAKSTPLMVGLPHREAVSLDSQLTLSAQSFRLRLPAGRTLEINARGSGPLFGELFRFKGGEPNSRPAEYFPEGGGPITYETPWLHGEDLLFVLQIPIGEPVDYELQLTTRPVLLFPVDGKDERAIQSFWGAPRDGGRRKHEGNDIFAPKGTNLLATTDGEITRLNNTGIGGKTVWLYDRERGLRYYYAHLDQQLVRKGQRVQKGEIVGTVGNTGNARTTPPHLHFGIYDNGAIDPFPFLQSADELPAVSPLSLSGPAAAMNVPTRGNHYLRFTPARDGEVIRQLENGEAVTGLAVTGRFYRVKTERGEVGYVNFD
ncbi:M23 family metallopeptidase [Neolewinella aurantiaca]|uniref:M23 family metallopeptidase n=1 Tax=Neolewinella aurantiaca TaxID=2602767 RepID=A0A5C7FLU0_9BACT|nr:M23 family metallopeptidase [Neolewinella aurantiaca]TXF88332.1 M23 family metallopeptidase [Neolewinella aurantiaca]